MESNCINSKHGSVLLHFSAVLLVLSVLVASFLDYSILQFDYRGHRHSLDRDAINSDSEIGLKKIKLDSPDWLFGTAGSSVPIAIDVQPRSDLVYFLFDLTTYISGSETECSNLMNSFALEFFTTFIRELVSRKISAIAQIYPCYSEDIRACQLELSDSISLDASLISFLKTEFNCSNYSSLISIRDFLKSLPRISPCSACINSDYSFNLTNNLDVIIVAENPNHIKKMLPYFNHSLVNKITLINLEAGELLSEANELVQQYGVQRLSLPEYSYEPEVLAGLFTALNYEKILSK